MARATIEEWQPLNDPALDDRRKSTIYVERPHGIVVRPIGHSFAPITAREAGGGIATRRNRRRSSPQSIHRWLAEKIRGGYSPLKLDEIKRAILNEQGHSRDEGFCAT